MRMQRVLLTGLLLASACIHPLAALAADLKADPVLLQLYLQELHAKTTDVNLEARITSERTRVHKDELKTLTAVVDQANADDAVISMPSTVPAATALQKEQTLVQTLQTGRQETKVDLDLLKEDQATLDQTISEAKGTLLDGALRRKADLLSRRAVLEERLSATDDVLAQEQDRLSRLSAQQRNANLAAMAQIALYIGIFVLIIVAERLVRLRLIVRIRDRNRRYLVVKLFTGTLYTCVIVWILYRISGNYPGFVTSFAIVGAGIAVALQSIIKDVVGWFLIVQKRLFRLGQRVTIGPYTGDIADISLLRTTLVEVNNTEHSDVGRIGQTLYLPNSLVLEGPVLNFHATSDFVEGEIPVTVTYGSDWKKAEEILRAILQEEVGTYVERARTQYILRTAHFFATQEPPEPRIFIDIAADGILFTLRFQIPIGKRRSISTVINRKILERFAEAKIGLAYKTVQVVQ